MLMYSVNKGVVTALAHRLALTHRQWKILAMKTKMTMTASCIASATIVNRLPSSWWLAEDDTFADMATPKAFKISTTARRPPKRAKTLPGGKGER